VARNAVLFPRGEHNVIDALFCEVGHRRFALRGIHLTGARLTLVVVVFGRPFRKARRVFSGAPQSRHQANAENER
jgi:hypothetical protein